MAVTRLRSDKGSFVQSPKKAFDSEPGEAAGTVSAQNRVSGALSFDPANCTVTFRSVAASTFATTWILNTGSYPGPPAMLSQWLTGGLSGATWSPGQQDWGGVSFHDFVYQCTNLTDGRDIYTGGLTRVDPAFPGETFPEYILTVENVGTPQMQLFTSDYPVNGEYVHPTGFQALEPFTMGSAEPTHVVFHWNWNQLLTGQQVFECPGQFTPPSYISARPFEFAKASSAPRFPSDDSGLSFRDISLVNTARQFNYFLNTASVPVTTTFPPCYTAGFVPEDPSGFYHVWDKGLQWQWDNYPLLLSPAVGSVGFRIATVPP